MDGWLNTLAIANILSFSELEKLYRISYDTTETGGDFVVHTLKGKVRFKKNELGLPYISLEGNDAAVCLLNTIQGNTEGYTKREVQEAVKARRAVSMVGGPTEENFAHMRPGLGFVQVAFLQQYGYRLDPSHIYLDTCANFSQVVRKEDLKNVRKVEKGLTAYCNAGKTYTDRKGTLGNMDVWLNTLAIANILSFNKLEKLYRISYDTTKTGGDFVVHTPKGEIHFKKNEIGIPYISLEGNNTAICLLNTIQGDTEGYTKREVQEAVEARRTVSMVGGPTEESFAHMVRHNMITDCPITTDAINRAHDIFGPDLAGIRGKTTRRKPKAVRNGIVQIPRRVVERNRQVWLAADVMFVDGLAFIVTVSKDIKFITAQFLPMRTNTDLAISLRDTMRLYQRGGFRVQTLLMDGEFDKVTRLLPEVVVNTTSAGEHVGDIERHIQTIKERGRGIMNTLPYKRMPARMVIELVYFCIMWLNAVPNKGGVSTEYSPREIV
ncbi:hypothetical protein ACHAXS_006188, partial [Conticribra weissflogii]